MELKRIIILALSIVVVQSGDGCHKESELKRKAEKKLRKHKIVPWNPPASPDFQFSSPSERLNSSECMKWFSKNITSSAVNARSLSPWKYETVTKPDHFPDSYSEARCLCNGCILLLKNGTVTHSDDYNSVDVRRSWTLLKRDQDDCKDGQYKLKWTTVEVTVGCTCARPDVLSS